MGAFKRRVRRIFLFHERDKRAETESLSLSLCLFTRPEKGKRRRCLS